jgi:hypothetical protein
MLPVSKVNSVTHNKPMVSLNPKLMPSNNPPSH